MEICVLSAQPHAGPQHQARAPTQSPVELRLEADDHILLATCTCWGGVVLRTLDGGGRMEFGGQPG